MSITLPSRQFEARFIFSLSQFLFCASYSFIFCRWVFYAHLFSPCVGRCTPNGHSYYFHSFFLCIFEAIKISMEYLVRTDIKVTSSVGFSLKFYRYTWSSLIERVCATQTENESISSFQKRKRSKYEMRSRWTSSLKQTGNIITINWTTKRSANLLEIDVCLIDIYYNYSYRIRHLTTFCAHRMSLRHEIDVFYFIDFHFLCLRKSLGHWIIVRWIQYHWKPVHVEFLQISRIVIWNDPDRGTFFFSFFTL